MSCLSGSVVIPFGRADAGKCCAGWGFNLRFVWPCDYNNFSHFIAIACAGGWREAFAAHAVERKRAVRRYACLVAWSCKIDAIFEFCLNFVLCFLRFFLCKCLSAGMHNEKALSSRSG